MPVETKSWPPKTPDAVLDYLYDIPLDEGDSVSSYVFTRLSGTIVTDSEARDEDKVTVTLSGGEHLETSVFKLSWVTSAGREDDTIITLAVLALEELEPTIAALRARYPAFTSVADATIAYWLKDAGRTVTDAWDPIEYEPALLSLAAHNMALLGLDKPAGDAVGSLAAMGVSSFKSASMSVNFDADTIKNANSGSFSSTKYGQLFLPYLRRFGGGVRLVGCA